MAKSVYRRSTLPRRRRSPQLKRLWLVLPILLAVGLLDRSWTSRLAALASPSRESVSHRPDPTQVNQSLTAVFDRYPGVTVSVALIDLPTGRLTQIGTDQPMPAASVTKLATAAFFLHQVETGQQSLDESIGDYPASWQLQQMIQQSDNDSWNLIDGQLGDQNLADYAHSVGLASFDLDDNTVTSADEARFLQALYDDRLLDQSDTKLLLSWMQNTNNEDLIPPALPLGTTIYHKYGLLDDALDDAAIVASGHRPFILVIFTDSSQPMDYLGRTNLFHDVAGSIWRFQNS